MFFFIWNCNMIHNILYHTIFFSPVFCYFKICSYSYFSLCAAGKGRWSRFSVQDLWLLISTWEGSYNSHLWCFPLLWIWVVSAVIVKEMHTKEACNSFKIKKKACIDQARSSCIFKKKLHSWFHLISVDNINQTAVFHSSYSIEVIRNHNFLENICFLQFLFFIFCFLIHALGSWK